MDGIVLSRQVDPGQTVASALQAPVLFTLAADLRQMRLLADVDEADIGEVAVGQPVTFTVHTYPDRRFVGTVSEVRNAPKVPHDVVTYGTVISVENEALALKPGMTASVRILTAEVHDVIRGPAAALSFVPPGQSPGKGSALWSIDAGTIRRVNVTPGITDGELTALSGEVSPGMAALVELTPEGRTAYGIGQ